MKRGFYVLLHSLLLGSVWLPAADEAGPREEAAAETVIDFEEGSPLSRVLRMLAAQAQLNYLEPPIDPEETVAVSFRGISPRDAFFRLARSRGFEVHNKDGFVELVRAEKPKAPEPETRVFALQHVDARLVIGSVANLLGLGSVKPPARSSPAFPEPANGSSMAYAGQSAGGFSNEGAFANGPGSSANAAVSTEGRFVAGLPMDTPLWSTGEGEGRLFVYLDRISNSIVVRAMEKQLGEVARYLQKLDVREPQIEITARVVEVELGRLRELGLDWSLGYSSASGRTQAGVSVKDGAASSALKYAGAAAAGMQAILEGWQVDVLLRAAQSENRNALVTDARVVTRSGIPAVVNNMVEERIEVFTSTAGSVLNANAGLANVPAGSVLSGTQAFQTGVLMDVLARVLQDGRIDLNIHPTVLTRIGETKGPTGQKLPIIVRRSTTTSVMVRDGLTVGIGGLMQMDESRANNEVPGASRIPLIGPLFRSSSRQKRKSNLVILVTPRILGEQFAGAPVLPEAGAVLEEANNALLNPTPWGAKKHKYEAAPCSRC